MTDEYHNPFISDAVQAVHKAVESANKNLDNALTVAVDALKVIADFSPNKTYSGTVAQQALTNIAAILKVKQRGGK